jgi:flagellar biosynthesis chaperone FliJ
LSYKLFHAHKRLDDDELKVRLKNEMDADEYCAHQLKKLEDNGVSYDNLWENKLYSAVSILINFDCIVC